MKSHLRHKIGFIDITCLPIACKQLGISVLIVALLGAFNFWWFGLLLENEPDLVVYNTFPADEDLQGAAKASFCSSRSKGNQSCDIFQGKWVPDARPLLYTNDTCPYIFPNQNCMSNGRPDKGFLHWRWQPHDCEIPAFDPTLFLRLMTGKSMLFVGDSMSRNQMQSLLCSIAQVETPKEIHESMWSIPSYNFTLTLAWSPFLVNYSVEEGTWKIHLDRPDEAWASPLAKYDVAVFNTLNWFFRRSVYYVNGKPVSEFDPANATSDIGDFLATLKHVWSTVGEYLVENYAGVAAVRTGSVAHFEGNTWDRGGTCYKTKPEFDPHRNMSLPWVDNEVLKLQKDEFRKAVKRAESSNSRCRLRLLDITYSTLLRPDGHPGEYWIHNSEEARYDCAHWCMPGPIDAWNQLLFADPQIMCS